MSLILWGLICLTMLPLHAFRAMQRLVQFQSLQRPMRLAQSVVHCVTMAVTEAADHWECFGPKSQAEAQALGGKHS